MKQNKVIRIFIDSNILDVIEELEVLPFEITYFYPNIDQTQMKKNHSTINLPKKKYPLGGYKYYPAAKRVILEAHEKLSKPENFYLIQRPNQRNFNESFNEKGDSLARAGEVNIVKARMDDWDKLLKELKKLLPNWGSHSKDFFVLATVLFCNDCYSWIFKIDKKGNNEYDFIRKYNFKNKENEKWKKYFVTRDKKGIFSEENRNKIMDNFSDLKIFYFDEFIQKFIDSDI